MLKISDFSKLSQISIRMLRFYDDKDILKPIIIKENGYRYYDSKQLLEASHLQYLRYLGFNTSQIKLILHTFQENKDIENYLQVHLHDLKIEQEKIDEKIKALTRTIEKMKKEDVMLHYQVEVKTIPSKYMMCKRKIIPSYDKEGLLWQGLYHEIAELNMNIERVDNGLVMAVFHDSGYKESEVDVEIRTEVKGCYEDTENIKFKHIPEIQVASITFTGEYEHITDVSYCIAHWITEHHYEICGPNFSIYHVGYLQTDNPKEFVTEICYPIKSSV